MKYVLAREGREALARFAWSRTLLAFDYDGTLAPIVEERDRADMRRPTADLLAQLCARYPCAIISGRSREDVSTRLAGAAVKYVSGNHGLEPGQSLDDFAAEIADVRPLLERALTGLQGVELEDKRYSLAIHYRKSRQKRAARAVIEAAVANLPHRMRIVGGKLVVNVIPERAPHKGDALQLLRAQEHADTAIYFGDDVTDEDVFELDEPGRLLTIRVGRSSRSAAAYYVRDQAEIDPLLRLLMTLRKVGAHGLAAHP